MVVTMETTLPTVAELTTEEVPLGTPYLKASAMHLGKACEADNNEFMLCRFETDDPRKCINEGKAVTACSMDFFRKIKANCAESFTRYAICLERGSEGMDFKHCRKEQAAFDTCMEDKVGIKRPDYGYHSLAKVHETSRPKPEEKRPAYMDDPRGKKLKEFPADLNDREKPRWGDNMRLW